MGNLNSSRAPLTGKVTPEVPLPVNKMRLIAGQLEKSITLL
jgi:hypothetical protein